MNPMNILTFSVFELKLALSGLGKLINRHTTLPVLQHLRVIRDGAGLVSLHAHELDSSLCYQFSQPLAGPVADFLVPFEPLNRILRSSKGQVCLLPEKQQVVVRTFVGQSPLDQRLDAVSVEEWPPALRFTALPVPFAKEAVQAVRAAMDFASEDATRMVINSVHLDVSNPEAHYVVGTNGRALFSANSFQFALRESITIPTHKFWLWNGLPEVEGTLTVQPPAAQESVGWLRFQLGPWTFCTKQREGNYPNWRQVVPVNHRVGLEFSPEAVTAALLAVPQLPGGDAQNKPVRLKITREQVLFEGGGTSLPIPGVSIDGSPMAISFNREYLLLCFRLGLSTIQLIDDLSPLVFTTDGQRAVVMPLRSETDAPSPAPEPQPEAPAAPVPTPETTPMTTTAAAITETEPPIVEALKLVDELREDLKQVLRNLNHTYALLRQLEKEKKATDKEIESVRAKLREIQSVKI
jgi:DNA polymerase III sliding clamp (beta) subunit (PCNA family)